MYVFSSHSFSLDEVIPRSVRVKAMCWCINGERVLDNGCHAMYNLIQRAAPVDRRQHLKYTITSRPKKVVIDCF